MIAKLERTLSTVYMYCIAKQGPNTEPPRSMGATKNDELTTTDPLP